MKLEDNKGSNSPQLEDDFYSSLPLAYSYTEALDLARQVPPDWFLVVADIVDSTKALSQGKYKEVNIAGAMGIMALGNLFGTLKRPFIFGGDGMSFLIPPEWLDQARSVLGRVLWDVEQLFQLQMRGAILPVSLIQSKGPSFTVSKLKVSETYQQAFFLGLGPAYAEELLKTQNKLIEPYLVRPTETSFASYQGFSCRWRDVPSPKGETAALIIEPTDPKALGFLYGELERILGTFEIHHPLGLRAMKLGGKTSSWRKQIQVLSHGKPRIYFYIEWMKQWFILLVMKFALTFKIPIHHGVYDLSRVNEMNLESSDIHKIDTGIKMILYCDTQVFNRLVKRLEQLRNQGILYYGINRTSAAHITCIASLSSEDDIHFVDATGGGYALAATQLKEQKQTMATPGQVEPTEQRFDSLAGVYEELFPLGPKTLDFVLSHSQPMAKILDLGCSTGQLLRSLASHDREGVGVDLSLESIRLAKQKLIEIPDSFHSKVKFIHGSIFDLSNLIPSDLKFQTVLCLGNTLPHADSLLAIETLVTTIYKLLVPRGICIVSLLHYDSILAEPSFQFPVIHAQDYQFYRSYGTLENDRVPFHTQLLHNQKLIFEENSSLFPISVKQLDRIVKKVGFSDISWYQDFESKDLETDSVMVVGVFAK